MKVREYRGDQTPVSPWSYFGHQILYAIPLIGWIILIIQAIGANNVNIRNFARSYFCILVIALVVIGIILIVSLVTGGSAAVIEKIKALFGLS